MRLHHLEMTAFGPFAGTETVDFDALADSGLFLLCGPTGAGKTSILDAVCFGLYGEVPGERNAAKRLRSDHAEPGTPPQVVLELTLGGRRFRIRRSPAWHRPKRRGSGTTLENAKVTLEERVDDGWRHLSSRLDETGQMLVDLLGMNAGQFTQVAMLPQGRFQSFLRARSEDRQRVLQQLFRTGRFHDVEKWLVGRRQALRAEDRAHQSAVASVVSRVCEAAEQDLPHEWDLDDLCEPAESGGLAGWLARLLDDEERELHARQQELAAARAETRAARGRLEAARTTAERQARHADAVRDADVLREGEVDAERTRDVLDRARRSVAVQPLLRVVVQAERAADDARTRLAPALAEAARLLDRDPGELDESVLAAAERRAREEAGVARALLPREAELHSARGSVDAADRRLHELGARVTRLEDRATALPAELARCRAEVEELAALAAGAAPLEQQEAGLVEQVAAAHRATDLARQLAEARARLTDAVDQAQAARERMHDIREARITGMAAELALGLAAGGSCPVCGSCEHPSPAVPAEGSPTQDDEQQARQDYEDADFVRQAGAEAVGSLEQNHAVAVQAAGGRPAADLEREIEEVRAHRQACATAAEQRDRLAGVVAGLEQELTDVRAAAADAHAATARLTVERETALRTVARIEEELAGLFGDTEPGDGVPGVVRHHEAAGATLAGARSALTEHDTALARARDAADQAERCAAEHGFTGSAAARDAFRDETTVRRIEAELTARAERLVRVRAVLDDPAVRDAAGEPPPDLGALEEQLDVAERQQSVADTRARITERRVTRLAALDAELRRELAAWAPTRAAYAVAHRISTFAEGKGGDNTLQMRLSAYVLAARLQQVVAAANQRLHTMSDERYTLEHTSTRGAGELRGGLSLLVRDEWTGESRDPATLSGGETFVVSLALALGLADVVTQEAGGADIDTLFVDEGFGSLDPETLDDVMDTLDELRDGGRVIGVVSHVPEMRTRITAQLQLHKDRSGSRVVATRAVV